MGEFHLSSVNFHPCESEQQLERKNYFIYIKEPSISYSKKGFAFYDALQLSDNSKKSDGDFSDVKSIATNNHQAIELHFRSKKDKQIVSVTIHLPTYQLEIASYIWQHHRRAFLKLPYPEHTDEQLVMNLLQRIYIKHQDKITFLSLNKNRSLGDGAKKMQQNK
ncbi:hypothetical protein [Sutcliffiella halmapala]|uniref:hypothetical protein n=1 Tax=Sutcliffiella halmapala TaxID=79882 RepID=UPI00099582F2|nr:hypothetical protein [Sutcliffiella halmapala]